MADPRAPRGPEGRDPVEGLSDEQRKRVARALVQRLQLGGIVFLAVACLGLLPAALSSAWPALGRAATIAVLVLAPAIPIGLLVFAAVRLRR